MKSATSPDARRIGCHHVISVGGREGSKEGKSALSRCCVYTVRHTDHIDNVYEYKGGSGEFTENKKWVQGEKLFREAERNSEKMPIFFAPAEMDGGLVYRAILTPVEVDDYASGTLKEKICPYRPDLACVLTIEGFAMDSKAIAKPLNRGHRQESCGFFRDLSKNPLEVNALRHPSAFRNLRHQPFNSPYDAYVS